VINTSLLTYFLALAPREDDTKGWPSRRVQQRSRRRFIEIKIFFGSGLGPMRPATAHDIFQQHRIMRKAFILALALNPRDQPFLADRPTKMSLIRLQIRWPGGTIRTIRGCVRGFGASAKINVLRMMRCCWKISCAVAGLMGPSPDPKNILISIKRRRDRCWTLRDGHSFRVVFPGR
jgi:hypothetical protein